MADDINSQWSSYTPETPEGNAAQGWGVSPDAAAKAIDNAPVSGIPPAVGMHSPQVGEDINAQWSDTQALNAHPALRGLAAQSPAHWAVARDDTDALLHTSALMDVFAGAIPNPLSRPSPAPASLSFGDIWKWIGGAVQGAQAATAPFTPGTQALHLQGMAQQQLAEGLASLPLPMSNAPLNPFERPHALTSHADRVQAINDMLNVAMLGLGVEGGVEGRTGASGGAPSAPSGPAPTAGPFNSPREAAQWIRTNAENVAEHEVYSEQQGSAQRQFYVRPAPPPLPPEAPPVGVDARVDAARASVAQLDADHVAAVQESIAGGKVQGRSPQVMQDFLAQWPNTTVRVDPEVLAQLAAQGHVPFPEHGGDVVRAAGDGGEVEVPLARYLTATAGQPFAQELNAASVFREEGTSVNAAKEAPTASGPETQSGVVQTGGVGAGRVGDEQFTPTEQSRVEELVRAHERAAEQAQRASYLKPLFTDAEALGMSPEQFAQYGERLGEVQRELHQRMVERAQAQVLRERKPDWQAAVDLHTEAAHNELNTQPNVNAMRAFRDLKIDRDVAELHPEASDLPASILKRGGLHPDEAADLAGYSSGDALLHDLAVLHRAVQDSGAKSLTDYLKQRARAIGETRARELLGHDISPDSIQHAAMELVNGPLRTDLLSAELQALGGAAYDRASLEDYARKRFEELPVRRAINSRRLEEGVYRHGVKAEKALLKGDIPRAFLAKQHQFVQHLMAQQSYGLQREVAKNDRVWSKLARKQLIKSVGPEYSAQILRALWELGYNIKRPLGELAQDLLGSDGKLTSLESFLASKSSSGPDNLYTPIPTALDGTPLGWKNMPVGDYRAVADMLNAMRYQGAQENSIRIARKKADLQAQVDRAVAQLNARGRAPITREQLDHPDVRALVDGWRRSFDAWGTRPEQMSIDFDNGDPLGVFNQAVTLPLQERKAWRDEAQGWVSKSVKELHKSLPKKFNKWLKLRVDVSDILDPNGDPYFTRVQDVVGAALHWDNADNRARLIAGLNYGKVEGAGNIVTEPQVQALLDRVMTPDAWKYVHGLQDLFAHFKSDMFSMYKRVNGISPKDVGANYYPISRDPRYLPAAGASPMQFMGDGDYFRATPSNPHAKGRTNAEYPLSLDLNLAERRINQVIHDIAFREVLMDADKFLGHRSIVNAISRKYGPEYAQQLNGWVRDVAGSLSFNPRDSQAVQNFLDWTNEGMIVDMIGYSLHTALLHAPTALVQSMQTVGAANFTRTLAEMMAKPSLWKEVWDESSEVRNRLLNSSEGARDAFLHLKGERNAWSQFQLYSMYLVSMSDQFSAMPTYLVAKRMFLSDPRTAPHAIALAEQQVRQAHGSAGVTEAPAALRGGSGIAGKFWKQGNQFLTFWNHMYNRQREIGQALGFAGNKRDFPRAMAGVFSYIIAVGAIHHLVQAQYGQKTNGAMDILMTPFEGMPFLNLIPYVADAAERQEPSDALQSMVKAMGATVKDVEKVAHGEHPSQRWIQNASNALGFIAHVPGNQLGRTLAGLHELHMKGATSPYQALHEIIAGPEPAHTHH